MRKRNKKNIWLVLFLGLFALKVTVLGCYLVFMDAQDKAVLVSPAMAQEKSEEGAEDLEAEEQPADPVKEFLNSLKQRRLVQIRQREESLNQRTRLLKAQEARLKKVQADLKKLLSQLQNMQASLDQKLKEREKLGQEQLARLAKVYEETPPEQAGPMLTKLDPRVAAQILIRMNPRKAGKIWGQVGPAEGVKISEELVKLK